MLHNANNYAFKILDLMKKLLFILLLTCISCSTPKICPNLIYDSVTKTTFLEDKELYTGRCLTSNEDESSSIKQYLNGKDYGKWTFYYANGQVETKGQFNKNGERVGTWKFYYESGALKQISKYSNNGDRTGKWVQYNPEGEIIDEIKY